MVWEFKKVFYGQKNGIDKERVRQFLETSYVFVPYTLFKGWYRVVYIEGEDNNIYTKINQPFPDLIVAQKPDTRFALHMSGGIDSSVLAKLYDRRDADYIHVGEVEDNKAQALAKTIKARFHQIKVSIKEFIETAEKVLPLYAEPEPDAASVLAYIASQRAKELGHNLIVTGDCGDTIFGGHLPKPHSEKAMVIWKTLHPNNLLGLKTLMPLGHPALKAWAKATLKPQGFDKAFLRGYCRELGLPKEVTEQRKLGWAGCWSYAEHRDVVGHMQSIIDRSKYSWVKNIIKPKDRINKTTFREYSLVKWLEHNDA